MLVRAGYFAICETVASDQLLGQEGVQNGEPDVARQHPGEVQGARRAIVKAG